MKAKPCKLCGTGPTMTSENNFFTDMISFMIGDGVGEICLRCATRIINAARKEYIRIVTERKNDE